MININPQHTLTQEIQVETTTESDENHSNSASLVNLRIQVSDLCLPVIDSTRSNLCTPSENCYIKNIVPILKEHECRNKRTQTILTNLGILQLFPCNNDQLLANGVQHLTNHYLKIIDVVIEWHEDLPDNLKFIDSKIISDYQSAKNGPLNLTQDSLAYRIRNYKTSVLGYIAPLYVSIQNLPNNGSVYLAMTIAQLFRTATGAIGEASNPFSNNIDALKHIAYRLGPANITAIALAPKAGEGIDLKYGIIASIISSLAISVCFNFDNIHLFNRTDSNKQQAAPLSDDQLVIIKTLETLSNNLLQDIKQLQEIISPISNITNNRLVRMMKLIDTISANIKQSSCDPLVTVSTTTQSDKSEQLIGKIGVLGAGLITATLPVIYMLLIGDSLGAADFTADGITSMIEIARKVFSAHENIQSTINIFVDLQGLNLFLIATLILENYTGMVSDNLILTTALLYVVNLFLSYPVGNILGKTLECAFIRPDTASTKSDESLDIAPELKDCLPYEGTTDNPRTSLSEHQKQLVV